MFSHTFPPNLPRFLHRYIFHICDIPQLCHGRCFYRTGCVLNNICWTIQEYVCSCNWLRCHGMIDESLILYEWSKTSIISGPSSIAKHRVSIDLSPLIFFFILCFLESLRLLKECSQHKVSYRLLLYIMNQKCFSRVLCIPKRVWGNWKNGATW